VLLLALQDLTAVLTASPVIPDEEGRTIMNSAFYSRKRRSAINVIDQEMKDAQKAQKRG
jgi:hypothetical protein